jgi:hypothetical protein
MHTRASAPSSRSSQSRFGGAPDRNASSPGDGFVVAVDGAVGYSLRLIPSNKIVGRYASTLEAWAAVLAAIDGGTSSRLLVLDWHGSDGSHGAVSSGRTLEYLARAGLGLPAEHLRSERASR